MNTNRRLHERLRFRAPLSIRVGSDHDLAHAYDLSVWGMSFRTRTPLLIGDEVHVHIEDVTERSLRTCVRHVAVSRGEYVVGVEHQR
jgi:hypothetical protein